MDLVSECVIDIAGTGMNTNKLFDVIGTSYTNCDRERVSLNLESQLSSVHKRPRACAPYRRIRNASGSLVWRRPTFANPISLLILRRTIV